MAFLLPGLLLFFAAHLVPTLPGLRGSLIARLGEAPYKLAFSLCAAAGLVMIVFGVSIFRGSAADIQIWTPPLWSRHLVFALMAPAFVLLAAAYIPSRLRDWAGHPMLLAIILWATAHLLANGDRLALLLFGSFLLFALFDRWSVARRAPARRPAATGWTGDAAALVVGLACWAAVLFWLHASAGAPLLAAR